MHRAGHGAARHGAGAGGEAAPGRPARRRTAPCARSALLFRLLPRGVAVHHAGLLPVVKMLVEELFQSGRLRAVFATDTLALGINMPARTVVDRRDVEVGRRASIAC